MLDLKINVVTSRAISGDELVSIFSELRSRTNKADFVQHVDGKIHGFPLRVRGLPNLDAFQKVFDVTLISTTREPRDYPTFVSFPTWTHMYSGQHAWTTWYVCESPTAQEYKKHDLSIFAGLRKEGYFSGVELFRPSPAVDDIARRRELFDRAITELGVSECVTTDMSNSVLTMRAASPWKLIYPSHEIPRGGNPLGFFVCGFSGIEVATSVSQRLVEILTKEILGISFVTRLSGEGYETVFRRLNENSQSWHVEVMGNLRQEAIAILKGGDILKTSSSAIPAFEWYPENKVPAYGSVIIKNGQRYLEIATDTGTLETLQQRVAFLSDIEFNPIGI